MSAKTIAIIGGSVAALSVITGVFFYVRNNKDDEETTDPVVPDNGNEKIEEETPVEWDDVFNPAVAPPAPQFDVAADTVACQ